MGTIVSHKKNLSRLEEPILGEIENSTQVVRCAKVPLWLLAKTLPIHSNRWVLLEQLQRGAHRLHICLVRNKAAYEKPILTLHKVHHNSSSVPVDALDPPLRRDCGKKRDICVERLAPCLNRGKGDVFEMPIVASEAVSE